MFGRPLHGRRLAGRPLAAGRGHHNPAGGVGRSALQILRSKNASFFLHDFLTRTDLTYQTAAGVTPADDSGEAVALAMSSDSMGGLTVAQALASETELLTGGDFASSSGWTLESELSIAGGVLAAASTAATRAAYRGISTVNQNLYRLKYDVSAFTAGSVAAQIADDNIGTNGDSIVSRTGVGTNYDEFHLARSGTDTFRFRFPSGATLSVDNASVKRVPGNHALQPGNTSFRPTRQSDGSVKGDGLDDNLLSTLTSSTSMCLIIAMLGGANPGSGVGTLIGGPISTTRGYLARNTSGQLCAGVGGDGVTTIVGGDDLSGVKGVAILNIDATGAVDLEWMPKGGALASLYSAPINGAVAAGTALRLWATNASGSAGNYGADGMYLAAGIQTTLTASERRSIATEWNARIPV